MKVAKPAKRRVWPVLTRHHAILRVQARLEDESFPRTQMLLLVGLTGGFGLLASFSLLRLGVETMALRYPLALTLAYGFFLFLIWLWLRTTAKDYVDLPDGVDPGDLGELVGGIARTGRAPEVPVFRSGGGGDFAGGGAGGSFDGTSVVLDDAVEAPLQVAGKAAGAAADADELAIPLLAVALAVGVALASLYIVYIAPVLFAEVLVDGALSVALFRRLRGPEGPHWLASACRRTVLPFAATAVLAWAVGAGLAVYAPGAHTLGQVMQHAAALR